MHIIYRSSVAHFTISKRNMSFIFSLAILFLYIVTFLFFSSFFCHLSLLSHFLCSSVIVIQWVVVTHIVTPSHFYVRYVAEKRENEALSKKINYFCCKDSCLFNSSDTLKKGLCVFLSLDFKTIACCD